MAHDPMTPEQVLATATAAFREGRYADAADGFRNLIKSHPGVAELHMNLGAALRAAGDAMGAREACLDATALMPQNGMAWFNLGNAHRDLGDLPAAIDAYLRADALMPGSPDVLNNLGVAYLETNEPGKAVVVLDRAIMAHPAFADALTNRGNAHQRLGDLRHAKEDLEAALSHAPENPVYRLNMSAYLAAAGAHADALAWAERAIDADPSYIEAQLKRASLLIQQGDFAEGFRAYEARWQKPNWHPLPERLSAPAWQGEDLSGKHLLVWNEQGFGDALMYARFLSDLAARAAKLSFMCEGALVNLMRESVGDTCEIVDLTATPPDTDAQISVMSLPHILGLAVETIPAAVPYLSADPGRTAAWRDRLRDTFGTMPVVGVVWAGNPKQAHDYARSISLETFAPILDVPDVGFVNLQVGPRGDDLTHPSLWDVRHELTDFAETAALMSALDLVVSVDSAPAHLAGSLGCKTAILLAFDPDSRYLLGRDDCPWYPTATLMRQSAPGDWPDVIRRTKAWVEANAAP